MGGAPRAGLCQPLRTSWMDQVAEVFGEPCLGGRVSIDQGEFFSNRDIVDKVPLVQCFIERAVDNFLSDDPLEGGFILRIRVLLYGPQ